MTMNLTHRVVPIRFPAQVYAVLWGSTFYGTFATFAEAEAEAYRLNRWNGHKPGPEHRIRAVVLEERPLPTPEEDHR